MSIRKIICILTAVLIAFFCLPVASLASDGEAAMTKSYTPEYRLSVPDCSDTEKKLSAYADIAELKELLLDAVSKARLVTDISEYNIPTSAHSELSELVFYGMPEAFNVYEVGYSYSGSRLLTIHLGYRELADTPEEYADCFAEMKKAADRLLEGIENNSSLSDEYKALLLHDRLCVHNEYTYYRSSTETEHTAYGALANGSSVCQGYAMAYMYLLNRAGIKNYYVSSDKLNHAWNIVYIDGIPYHVDVTFDDINWKTPDDDINVPGALKHDNFLVSTNTLKARNHDASDFDSTPTDTKYDDFFWSNSETEIQLVGNKLYYIDNENERLMCADEDEPLASVASVWTAGGSSFWVGNFSRLSSCGAELLYSTSDSIYKYTVTTGKSEKIYSPYLHKKFSIYGFTYKDGKLVYDVNTAPPGGDMTYLNRETSPYSASVHIISEIKAECEAVFYIGDTLNPEEIAVTAYFTDGTSEKITENFEISGFDSTSAGEKLLTVVCEGLSTECTVLISTPAISLSCDALTLAEKEIESVTAETFPAGQTVKWKCSADTVTVSDGKITGVKTGSADVTAELTYNGRVYTAVCRVTVLCSHKNTATHKEISPTVSSIGYTEGVFCEDCKKYIFGHEEIPKLDLSLAPSDFMISDGVYVRIIVGKLAAELLAAAPYNSTIEDKNGNAVGDRCFVATGMVLVLPDMSRQEITVVGDVDGDGSLSAADARLSLRASVGLEGLNAESAYYKAADADRVNSITAADARLILRASVGLEDNTLWL